MLDAAEQLERDNVIKEALTWVDTPFLHDAEVKGAGCDCAHLITGVYAALGYMPHIQFPTYGRDWFRHATDENQHIIENALKYFVEITAEEAKPGDWLVLHIGRAWAHCAIITGEHKAVCAWPQNSKVTSINTREDMFVRNHKKRYFTAKWKSNG